MQGRKVEYVYNLIVSEIRTTRSNGFVPDLASIVAGLKAELQRDIGLGRFSEREAREISEAIEIAKARVRRDWAYI